MNKKEPTLDVDIDRLIYQVFYQLPSENHRLAMLKSGINRLIQSECKKAKIDELERIAGYSDIKWFGEYREERLAELKELESKEEA